ncbi:hypothetical protein BJY16_001834 [Actinoplanes octamycinicus]|uniref:Uncharacterized protein n=1 Tax=Actinoplanes octamycinicus TaxID=135948 RepID=A0A7W7M655_9ACTN|nr:hypothetical protein [Actinoplanes octamycinicus]MBB4738375.1 hypothetical protein [Actinoplanes octamycinicus]GIE57493.1 hypothetical protein Aoc01nite_28950 [Actinoplanes octamycinicus]
MTGWDDEQLTAGFRSMMLLAALVERGGRPAAVSPTVRLSPGEKQYGWFPADVAGDGRRVVVVTDQRIVVGERPWALRALTEVRSEPADWAVTLRMRGRPEPLTLSGPWVPWLGVVLCAELYSAAFPPEEADGYRKAADMRAGNGTGDALGEVKAAGVRIGEAFGEAKATGVRIGDAFGEGKAAGDGRGRGRVLPGPRVPVRSVDPDLGLQRQRVVVPHPVHRGDRHPGASV